MYYTRLEVDRVKPWISVRINFGLGLRGPDIRPDNRNLSRVEVDRVKPWNSVRINLHLGPDVRPGLDNGHLIMRRS